MTTAPPDPVAVRSFGEFSVRRLGDDDPHLLAAAGMLAPNAGPEAGRRFLTAAAVHGIDLTHFWVSLRRQGVGQVCLAVPGAGQTATFFTSTPANPSQVSELGVVIGQACEGLARRFLGQALLEPDEMRVREAFERAGFWRLAELAYLHRNMPRRADELPGPAPLPPGIEVSTWRSGDDEAVCTALERSYEQTLDCPKLCGLRSTAHVLESHRATGEFDPRCWWIVRQEGRAEGVMLFNPCPDQSSVELVYMGLSPALRGLGLGRSLLLMGLRELAGRGERTVSCAVDLHNAPARRLYEGVGFGLFARRQALICAIG